MCMVSINVDEAALRDMRPELDTTEEVYDAIEQRVKNRRQAEFSVSVEHAIDVETMRERLHRMVHEVYSMP